MNSFIHIEVLSTSIADTFLILKNYAIRNMRLRIKYKRAILTMWNPYYTQKNSFCCRVGIIIEAPKALISQDFWGLFSPFDSRLIAKANFGFILFTPV